MKKFLFIIPLFILSCFFYLNEEVSDNNSISKSVSTDKPDTGAQGKLVSDYNINVQLLPEKKLLKASERIVWRNLTDSATGELYFHLYPNALASNKTEFTKKTFLEDAGKTKIEFSSFKIDGEESTLEYVQPEVKNPYDSTVAKIELGRTLMPGDSVIIDINYSLPVPISVKRFGYAAGRNFFFIAQWFPKLGVFEDGKWICSQYHYTTEFYADFSNYSVSITVPENYEVGSSGLSGDKENSGGLNKYLFKLNNAIDFAWFASDEISAFEKKYTSRSGKEIELRIFTQPENKKKEARYWKALENTLEYLESNIGEFPYSTLTCVDVPRTSNLGGMEYPTLVTFFTPLFSPRETNSPEGTIAHEIVHQYFYASVANNEVYEGWMDEGVTSYLEEKILDKYYGDRGIYFRFIDYYPIFGINFLSFYEIPVIYSLQDMYSKSYANDLYLYYANNGLGSIRDTSYLMPGRLSYAANAYSKPALAFRSIERYLGEDKFLDILSSYYNKNKFSHVKGSDLINAIEGEESSDKSYLVDGYINGNYRYDYKLTSITQKDSNRYELLVENLEDGKCPVDIRVYTEDDSISLSWDGKEDWKVFSVKSDKPVIAAEIDPERKNLFDENFANNSYTVETKYWAAYSISIRWLFWVQNALLVLGSLG